MEMIGRLISRSIEWLIGAITYNHTHKIIFINTGWDKVHPTWEGYRMLADRIWMVKNANNVPF